MAAVTSTRYEYIPLRKFQSIRLLELLPGPPSSPLRCRLIECAPGHDVPYEALSYTWNAAIFLHNLLVQELDKDCTIPITQNLHDALHVLRYESAIRVLWVDAVCINQNDHVEKGHQIKYMGPWFQDAKKVIIWLGAGSSDSLKTVEALHFVTQDASIQTEHCIEKILGIHERNLYEHLKRRFITLPWFHRVWTVQEFVLAQEVQFQLAHTSLQPATIYNALQAIDAYFARQLLVTSLKDTAFIDHSLSLIKSIKGLFQFRAKFSALRAKGAISLTGCVLGLGRQRDCTRVHDRVYGMLGLSYDLAISIDYTLPPLKVWNNFIVKSLKSRDLSVLHACSLDKIKHGKPSYIPPFSKCSDSWHLPIKSTRSPFVAGERFPVDLSVNAGYSIAIKGTFIDTVKDHTMCAMVEIMPPLPQCTDNLSELDLAEVYQDVLHCLHSHYHSDNTSSDTTPGRYESILEYETAFEVIGRSMHPDITAVPKDSAGKMNWLSAPCNKIRHSCRLSNTSLHHLHRYQLWDKRLFGTGRGYIGFGSRGLQAGDHVVIFDGDKTPFLIRPEENTNDIATGRYKLVSDCYLHGWMYGDYFGHEVVDSHQDARGEDVQARDVRTAGSNILAKQVFTIC